MAIGWLKVSLPSMCCCCFGCGAFAKTNLCSFEKLRRYNIIFAPLSYKYRTAGHFRWLKIFCCSGETEFTRLQQDKLGSCLPHRKSNISLSQGDSQSSESAVVCSFTFLVVFFSKSPQNHVCALLPCFCLLSLKSNCTSWLNYFNSLITLRCYWRIQPGWLLEGEIKWNKI